MRIRRHTGAGFGRGAEEEIDAAEETTDETVAQEPRGDPWKRFARDMGLVALVALIGYAISGYWISPDAVLLRGRSGSGTAT